MGAGGQLPPGHPDRQRGVGADAALRDDHRQDAAVQVRSARQQGRPHGREGSPAWTERCCHPCLLLLLLLLLLACCPLPRGLPLLALLCLVSVALLLPRGAAAVMVPPATTGAAGLLPPATRPATPPPAAAPAPNGPARPPMCRWLRCCWRCAPCGLQGAGRQRG